MLANILRNHGKDALIDAVKAFSNILAEGYHNPLALMEAGFATILQATAEANPPIILSHAIGVEATAASYNILFTMISIR